mmetsp:Transcript_12151/g.14829  ORF Transcript_12151/g.14829 Transcript_12151/m.14829 type:complete len:146 (-) Transcript_12151:101-538(-)
MFPLATPSAELVHAPVTAAEACLVLSDDRIPERQIPFTYPLLNASNDPVKTAIFVDTLRDCCPPRGFKRRSRVLLVPRFGDPCLVETMVDEILLSLLTPELPCERVDDDDLETFTSEGEAAPNEIMYTHMMENNLMTNNKCQQRT